MLRKDIKTGQLEGSPGQTLVKGEEDIVKYGYIFGKQEKATRTVLEQAKLLGYEWAR